MEKEVISVLSNLVIAFSTFIGVGSAIAYYMKDVQNTPIGYIILTETIYLLIMIIVLMGVKSKIE